ncbi:MAG: hypothetical protein MJZ16_10440 [Bacteroidales bacterium]|nr:hypothetical protein [Bacteroidales bacterium]
MEIYSDNFDTSRTIWLDVEDGRVMMTQQDLGDACYMICGDDEYEREVSCALADMELHLGVLGADAVIALLSERFRTVDSIDRFMDFLSSRGIRFDYYSD